MVIDFPDFVTDFLKSALEWIAPHFADGNGIPKQPDRFSRLLKKSFESFETGLSALLRMRKTRISLMVRRRDSAVSNHGDRTP